MKLNEIDSLPITSGVYKFLDSKGTILYIGKANNLRNRVRSYFNNELYDRPFVKQMIPKINSIEIVRTNNEIESLVLESALIKKFSPKYNSDLKDDKSYVWIYITTKDDFPTVKIVRKISDEELKRGEIFGPYPKGSTVKRVFTYLRKLYPFCTCSRKSSKECLYFHLGMCPRPYQGHISKKDYRKNINEIIKFLKGRKFGQIGQLEIEMRKLSKERKYEQAGIIRDRIKDLKYLGEKIDFQYGDTEETYQSRRITTLKENFENLRIELCLPNLHRIECYDVSNIQGKNPYTSMSVAIDGEIVPNEYRIFGIKELSTPNDPEMLKEALNRRFTRREKYSAMPDIVLIDGGKSQLSVVSESIPEPITIIGISKGKRLKRKGKRLLDEFWYFNREKKLVSRVDIKNSNILINLRDEAHRFAILHHRKARIRDSKRSQLLRIESVGEKRVIMLIKSFGNIENIKKASFEELNSVLKNTEVSKKILEHFSK